MAEAQAAAARLLEDVAPHQLAHGVVDRGGVDAQHLGQQRRGELAAHHRGVARALERRAGSGGHALYPELAHHWSMADEPARAIEFLEKAGARGLAMGAYQDTIDFLTRALSLAERVDVSRRRRGRWQRWLGEAAWGLGDIDACGAHVTAALAALDRPLPTSRGGWLRVAGHHLAAQAWRLSLIHI